MGSSCETALWWMPQDTFDIKSTLAQLMAWCHQATSHYLSQCWPRSISPYDIPRPQKVNVWQICLNDDFSTWGPIMRTKFSWESMVMCSDSQVHFVISWGCNPLNTLRLKQNGWHVGDNIFKCISVNVICGVLFRISLMLCRVQLMISQHWFSTYFFNPKPFPEFILCASPSLKELIVTS